MNENEYMLLIKDKIFMIRVKLTKQNIYRLISHDDKKILMTLYKKSEKLINLKEITSL